MHKSQKIESSYPVDTDRKLWRRLDRFRWLPRPTTLDRYIFVEILIPFTMWLLFFTTLFISIVLKDVVGEMIGKGVGFAQIAKYLSFLVLEKLTETIPMSCLMAGIMASGRLSGDSEITAMRSAGLSFPRIYAVFLFFGVASMFIVAFMNLYIGPVSAKAREDFEEEIKTYHSISMMKPGRFLGRGAIDGVSKKGRDIYVEKNVSGALKRVQIREWFNNLDEKNTETVYLKNMNIPIGDGYLTQIVHAERGEIINRRSPGGEIKKVIRLEQGFVLELNEERTRYEVTDFRNGHMDYVIPPPVKSMGRLNVRPDNYTFLELIDFINKLEEGGSKIDLCSIVPGCNSEDAGMNVKLGDSVDEDSGHVLTLPAHSQMGLMVEQEKLWLFTNMNKQGKPDGPTTEEFQKHLQFFMILQGFLKDTDKTRRKFEVEIHKRIAIPVACLLFFFISFPLGLVVKRSGKGMSFALAGAVFTIYNIALTAGLSQAYRGKIPPELGAWLSNIIILLPGIYIMSTRTDDFSPLKFLKRPLQIITWPFRWLGRKVTWLLVRVAELTRLNLLLAWIYRFLAKIIRKFRKSA